MDIVNVAIYPSVVPRGIPVAAAAAVGRDDAQDPLVNVRDILIEELAADMRGDPKDIVHQLEGVRKDGMIDALENVVMCLISLVALHLVCIVHMTGAIRGGTLKPALELKVLYNICQVGVRSSIHPQSTRSTVFLVYQSRSG